MQRVDDFWAAGELASKLPKGCYQIQGDESLVSQLALGFVLGGFIVLANKSLKQTLINLLRESFGIGPIVHMCIEA